MAKLNYCITDELKAMFEEMRVRKGSALVVLTLELDKLDINVEVNKHHSEFNADYTPYNCVKEMLHDEAQFKNKPCIMVFDHHTVSRSKGTENESVIAFRWNAEGSKVKERMIYSSGWKSISTYFSNCGVCNTNNMFEASDWDDVTDKMSKYE